MPESSSPHAVSACPEGAMRIVSGVTGPMLKLARKELVQLSPKARQRLKWIEWHLEHDQNVCLTARHFAISRETFYRWWRRYDPRNLATLEDRPSRPRRRRRPTWTTAQVLAVKALRERFPRWGKLKLAVLLLRQGFALSASMVGRILRYLKAHGQLKEPPLNRTPAQRRRWQRPYATRKPKEYLALHPGDLVQVDTLDLRDGRRVLKQFTAIDVASRCAVVTVASNATASLAVRLLDALDRLPFAVRAIQVDGGSEFMAAFEAACQARGILLFVLPPHSPKLNGRVERLNRTAREECYDLTLEDFTVSALSRAARRWEHTYNHIRPHQALGMLTPAQFLAQLPLEEVSRTY